MKVMQVIYHQPYVHAGSDAADDGDVAACVGLLDVEGFRV